MRRRRLYGRGRQDSILRRSWKLSGAVSGGGRVVVPADLLPLGKQSETLQCDGDPAVHHILRCHVVRIGSNAGSRGGDEIAGELEMGDSATASRKYCEALLKAQTG